MRQWWCKPFLEQHLYIIDTVTKCRKFSHAGETSPKKTDSNASESREKTKILREQNSFRELIKTSSIISLSLWLFPLFL